MQTSSEKVWRENEQIEKLVQRLKSKSGDGMFNFGTTPYSSERMPPPEVIKGTGVVVTGNTFASVPTFSTGQGMRLHGTGMQLFGTGQTSYGANYNTTRVPTSYK